MYRIMIVEDDEKILELVERHLSRYGYLTGRIEDYSRIREEFLQKKPDLVLMDINLPFYDGFYWCREIRSLSNVPIIFISARGSEMDQVMALEHGGDDYIIKPFSLDVLAAKIRSVLRRVYGEYSEGGRVSEVLEVDGLFAVIDQSAAEFKGKRVELSKKEFQLLCLLMKNIHRIVTREELLEALWDDLEFVDDNTLSVNITRLRKRLEELGIRDAVDTVRGLGYQMNPRWAVK